MKTPSFPFFLHSRVAPVVTLLFTIGGGPSLLLAEDEFFRQKDIFFWEQIRHSPAPAEIDEIFPETVNMPEPVRNLVSSPTGENAFRYLAWQQERVRRITRAVEALRKIRMTPILFTRPDCPHCREQERILRSLDLHPRRIDPIENPELAAPFDITVVPTLVLNGRVFRGVASPDTLRTLLETVP